MNTADDVFGLAREISKASPLPAAKKVKQVTQVSRALNDPAKRAQVMSRMFGSVHKSQLRDGRYVPASKLSELGRAKQRDALKNGSLGRLRGPSAGAPSGRGMKAVYGQAAVGEHIDLAVKEPTRASSVHRNLHFGSTISPELAAKIEAAVDPKLLTTPVAFHRGAAGLGIVAGGAGSHVTTGGMGRVVIGRDMVDASGRLDDMAQFSGMKLGEVINHELVHATTRGKNPTRLLHYDGQINQKKALGEEARADGRGVRGSGLYQRSGVIQNRSVLHEADRQVAAGMLADSGMSRGEQAQYREALGGQKSYHDIHEKLQRLHHSEPPRGARPSFTPPPPPPRSPHGLPHLPRLTRLMAVPRNRTMLLGAAAGGVGGYLGFRHKRAQMARDADGDGKVFDGTPQERAVSKALLISPGVDHLFATARGEVAKGLALAPKLPRPAWVSPRRRLGQVHPHDPAWISRGTHWSPKDGEFAGKTNPNFNPLNRRR